MRRTDSIEETRGVVRYWREHGHSVGLVPTMGFLHEGHVSLIRRARVDNEKVAVSIFVNPTQFGPGEDYESYPRDLERDLSVLSEETSISCSSRRRSRCIQKSISCTWTWNLWATCSAARNGPAISGR